MRFAYRPEMPPRPSLLGDGLEEVPPFVTDEDPAEAARLLQLGAEQAGWLWEQGETP